MPDIELATYIESLRGELEAAIDAGKGKQLRFFNDRIEIELDVGVETRLDGKGEAKFRFLVFDATIGGQADRTFSHRQRLKLSLVPALKSEKEGVWISGTGAKMGF